MNDNDALMGLYIQVTRIYELLSIIAHKLDPEMTEKILSLQDDGIVYSAPPAQVGYVEDGRIVRLDDNTSN